MFSTDPLTGSSNKFLCDFPIIYGRIFTVGKDFLFLLIAITQFVYLANTAIQSVMWDY